MPKKLMNGYCYGGPAHGEYFNDKTNDKHLTIQDAVGKQFTYKLTNIPPGSDSYHWLPADVPDERAMDFAFEMAMANIVKRTV